MTVPRTAVSMSIILSPSILFTSFIWQPVSFFSELKKGVFRLTFENFSLEKETNGFEGLKEIIRAPRLAEEEEP